MKKNLQFSILIALLAAFAPFAAMAQTIFFTDNFSNGSTTNQLSIPGGTPTASYTSYDMASSKNTFGSAAGTNTTIGPNDLHCQLTATSTSGFWEEQALFAVGTNKVSLNSPGDYIELDIVFTNSAGTLINQGTASPIYIGLFNSEPALGTTNPPVAGTLAQSGVTSTSGSIYATGNCEQWAGYAGRIFSGAASQIIGRPAQNGTGTASANQELFVGAATSSGFNNPGPTFTASSASQTFTPMATTTPYTMMLRVTLNTNSSSVIISNALYSGAGTGGTPLMTNSTVTSTANTLATTFDGFSFGTFSHNGTLDPVMDVSLITISGQSSPVQVPIITTEPVSALVATNGSCAFYVAATGNSLTYNWYRNGTNLTGTNIFVVTDPAGANSLLEISPVGTADAGTNLYYVTVTAGGILSTNSTTNTVTLIAATNLYWGGGAGAPWDVNTSANWNTDDGGQPSMPFNYGDPVVFDDGGGGGSVTLNGQYLSAASVTVNEQSVSFPYTFTGSGSFAGPGSLIYIGSTKFNITNVNTYTGGTIISNASANLQLENAKGLGTGPVILAKAGGQMEWTVAGGSTSGLGDVIVADDFTMQFDAASTYAGVILGNLSGTNGKTLYLNSNPANTTTNERVRVYGASTICDANIAFDTSGVMSLAPYNGSGTQTYNGVISGNGSIWQRGSASTILNGANTYSNGTYATTGGIGLGINSTPTVGTVTSGPIGTGPLYISPEAGSASGSGTVFASGGPITIANALQYPTNNQILIIGGTNALTFTGPYKLNGNDGLVTNRTFQVNNTNAPTAISGVISDGGTGCGFIKTGSGNLYLNGVNTYTGNTTNSTGLLAGSGSLASAVFVTNGASIGGGSAAAIGTLTINSNLTLGGNVFIRVNKSLAPQSNDVISVSGVLANTGVGSVIVTNLGPALVAGDRFYLFNKALTGGSSLTISNLGSSVTWSNGLAVDGSITVLPSAPPTIITQPAGRAVALGSSVTLSVTASTSTGVTNYVWQMNSNSISAGNVSGITASALTITNFQATNAGYYRAVVSDGNNSTNSNNARLTLAVSPTVASSGLSGTTLTLQIPTEIGPTYLVQTNSNLTSANWQTAATISGDGTTKPFTTIVTSSPQLFIRVKMQ